jgi:hypothetical protein
MIESSDESHVITKPMPVFNLLCNLKKRYFASLFVIFQLVSLTAMDALARPIKIPPPPPPPVVDTLLAILSGLSSLFLP